MRTGQMSLAAAEEIFCQAEQRLGASEHAPVDRDVLRLAAERDITAYDAYFVATAQELESPLLTQDRELLIKFPNLAVSLADFAAGRN